MLGTVVAMAGFFRVHFSAAGANVAWPLRPDRRRPRPLRGHHLHGDQRRCPPAPVSRSPDRSWRSEAKLYCGCMTSILASITRSTIAGRLCVLTPDEADLALLLGLALRLHQFVGDLRRDRLTVQMPDVQVIGAEFREAACRVPPGCRLRSWCRTCWPGKHPSACRPAPRPPCARSARPGSCGRYRSS